MKAIEGVTPGKREGTAERILETARETFRRKGFENATMREIAREAGVALGAAYYYYKSKDAMVMAFYERAQMDMAPQLEEALSRPRDLRTRLHAIIKVKLKYFEQDRSLLGALSAHIDPAHSLSPFGQNTAQIRERDINLFRKALSGARDKPHRDLQEHLPKLLWMYQMGILLYWTYDHSPGQARTDALLDKTLNIVATLIRFSGLPPLRPVRKLVRELMAFVYG